MKHGKTLSDSRPCSALVRIPVLYTNDTYTIPKSTIFRENMIQRLDTKN